MLLQGLFSAILLSNYLTGAAAKYVPIDHGRRAFHLKGVQPLPQLNRRDDSATPSTTADASNPSASSTPGTCSFDTGGDGVECVIIGGVTFVVVGVLIVSAVVYQNMKKSAAGRAAIEALMKDRAGIPVEQIQQLSKQDRDGLKQAGDTAFNNEMDALDANGFIPELGQAGVNYVEAYLANPQDPAYSRFAAQTKLANTYKNLPAETQQELKDQNPRNAQDFRNWDNYNLADDLQRAGLNPVLEPQTGDAWNKLVSDLSAKWKDGRPADAGQAAKDAQAEFDSSIKGKYPQPVVDALQDRLSQGLEAGQGGAFLSQFKAPVQAPAANPVNPAAGDQGNGDQGDQGNNANEQKYEADYEKFLDDLSQENIDPHAANFVQNANGELNKLLEGMDDDESDWLQDKFHDSVADGSFLQEMEQKQAALQQPPAQPNGQGQEGQPAQPNEQGGQQDGQGNLGDLFNNGGAGGGQGNNNGAAGLDHSEGSNGNRGLVQGGGDNNGGGQGGQEGGDDPDDPGFGDGIEGVFGKRAVQPHASRRMHKVRRGRA